MDQAAAKLVIRNIGLMLSGKLEEPVLDADCLVAEGGKITAWGREKDLDPEGASTVFTIENDTNNGGAARCRAERVVS